MQRPAPAERSEPRSSVLVVDDEQGPRESLRMILASEHDVHVAGDGASALEILRTTEVDLVTVDLNMPGMRGEELVRTVRQEFPHVEVVVITGYGTLENAVEGLRHGICDFLTKPFDVIQVGAAVDRALARNLSRRNLVSFLERLGALLGRDRDAEELLSELEASPELRRRLRSLLDEPALEAPPEAAATATGDRRASGLLEALAETIERRDPFLRGHARRTALLAGLLVERLGGSAEERERVRLAAFLHDLGKVGVPSELLRHPGPLDRTRRAALDAHVQIGERLLQPLGLSVALGPAIRHHHERWDGTGHPDGLAGEAIPLAARVIAVADAYESLTSDRPWRPALAQGAALEELHKGSGSRFDPHLVQQFTAIVEKGLLEPRTAVARDPWVRGSESAGPSAARTGGNR